MQILIENTGTHEFLTTAGKWTKSPLQAKQFPGTAAALRAARQEQIGKFNVVFYIAQNNQVGNLDHGRGIGEPEAVVLAAPIATVTVAG